MSSRGAKNRTTVLKKEIKNSTDKRLSNGDKPGTNKNKYEHRASAKASSSQPKTPVQTSSEPKAPASNK